mgnify:CR=1 FL=1
MDNQEAKDVEEAIKHLEDILYVLRSNYKYRTSYAIELLINGYRTLEKHIGFYEKHGSYKARIIELEDQVEELKNLANNTQWISPCYVAENYIAIEKVDKKIEELDEKIKCEHNEKVLILLYAQRKVLQELKEG